MPTLEELYHIRYSSGDALHHRIAAAILAEPAETTGHPQRLIWATAALAADAILGQAANQFAWPVVLAGATDSDAELQRTVAQLANTFAGIS